MYADLGFQDQGNANWKKLSTYLGPVNIVHGTISPESMPFILTQIDICIGAYVL